MENFLNMCFGDDNFDPDGSVNPILLFPGRLSGVDYATPQQLNHTASFRLAIRELTLMQDGDDTQSVSFYEFNRVLTAAGGLELLSGDVLLACEAMLLRANMLMESTEAALEECQPHEQTRYHRLQSNFDTQMARLNVVRRLYVPTISCSVLTSAAGTSELNMPSRI